MADLRIDLAAEFRGKKAFKQADKAVSGLDKAVGKLGKQMASVFAVSKVYAFGKASVRAFAEDQKSVTLLANTLKNLGLAFEQTRVADFITNLEKTSGVLDSELRPALQKLLTTTGSVGYAQNLLQQAIDISRGSGVDLATVVADLSNAYVGNTKGLKKYATGLTNAELAAMSFTQIQEVLNKQFSGSSAAYLSTYAGKMDLLTVAADNAKEVIGKSLVDAFATLAGGGDEGIQKLIDGINNLAVGIANTITGIAYYVKKLFDNPIVQKLLKAAWWLATHVGALSVFKRAADKGASLSDKTTTKTSGLTASQQAQLTARDIAARKKADEVIRKAKAKADAAQAAKDAAAKKQNLLFDMNAIELVAALKGKLSDDERLRAELQLQLLVGNDVEAAKLSEKLAMAQDATGKLAMWLRTLPDAKNPFAAWDTWLAQFKNNLASTIVNPTVPASTAAAAAATMPTASDLAAQGAFSQLAAQGAGASGGFSPVVAAAMSAQSVVNVTVQGSVIKEQELIDLIQNGTQLASLSGSPSQIGRIAGMFG